MHSYTGTTKTAVQLPLDLGSNTIQSLSVGPLHGKFHRGCISLVEAHVEGSALADALLALAHLQAATGGLSREPVGFQTRLDPNHCELCRTGHQFEVAAAELVDAAASCHKPTDSVA